MLSRKEVEGIKKQYPKGTKIRLCEMEGETTVPPGTKGTVTKVDDIGQIHVKWENGSSLAINTEVDDFYIVTPQEELSEKKEREFLQKINQLMRRVNFTLLNTSCNGKGTIYAAEKLLAMHQAFEEVYGKGYVDESYGMVLMPAVVRGRKSGIHALALVSLDLESSGEHWGTTFFTPKGPWTQGDDKLTEEQKGIINECYIPYDYWYTPLVERDHHVNFNSMPESVVKIRRLVEEHLASQQAQEMEGPKQI
ncbi:MAG: DUF4314 domain-containing protein [Lachnospiraceae bacterium]|nr:DUF4314 domain-containing protein [Lachnospiraceae bacterium]